MLKCVNRVNEILMSVKFRKLVMASPPFTELLEFKYFNVSLNLIKKKR